MQWRDERKDPGQYKIWNLNHNSVYDYFMHHLIIKRIYIYMYPVRSYIKYRAESF